MRLTFDMITMTRLKCLSRTLSPVTTTGVMGVPISFLDKYNPDQFEIVGTRTLVIQIIHTELSGIRRRTRKTRSFVDSVKLEVSRSTCLVSLTTPRFISAC
jgi:hypothetical protein